MGKAPSYPDDTPGGTRNSWSTPSTSQPGTTRTRGDTDRTSGNPPGTPRKTGIPAPPKNGIFRPAEISPPRGGPPPGGPPGTPQNGVFLEGYFVFFCALRVYTPLYPPKWPKKGSKKVSRFCPDWESY